MSYSQAADVIRTMGTPRERELDAYYFAHGRRADMLALATRIIARTPRILRAVA